MKKKILIAIAVLVGLAVVVVGATFVYSAFTKAEQALEADLAYKRDKKEFDAVIPGINKIERKYKKWGYIPYSKADEYLNEVMEHCEKLKQEGLIKDYVEGGLTLPSGIHVLIMPPLREALSAGKIAQIATFAPYDFTGEKTLSGRQSIAKTAENISNHFAFDYIKQLKSKRVTLEELERLGNYDIVIWQGHGGYNTEVHSALLIPIKWKEYKNRNQNKYEADFTLGRICLNSKEEIFITSKWFDEYLPKKENGGIIFLGACSTGKDDVLANSLMQKGTFSTVYGFNGQVQTMYSIKVRDTLFSSLSSNATVEEAYHKTVSVEGKSPIYKGSLTRKHTNDNLRLRDFAVPRTTPEENHSKLEAHGQTTSQPLGRTEAVPEGYIPIYTAQDLDNVRKNLKGNYILMNDIDLSGWDNWVPIGDNAKAFEGTFDGNGHVIKNMTIREVAPTQGAWGLATHIGLFGDTSFSTIENLGMVSANIRITSGSNIKVGTIAGGSSGVIKNCYNENGSIDVDISTADLMIGGIVGSGAREIINCYNTGKIEANSEFPIFVGGVAGSAGAILDSYNIGTITVTATSNVAVGGIASICSTATNCYNTANIRASARSSSTKEYTAMVGGIVGTGSMDFTSTRKKGATISHCYNIGNISVYDTEKSIVGGIAGEAFSISDCFNTGTLYAESTENYANAWLGGIQSTAYSNSNCVIRNCYNVGTIETASINKRSVHTGGIVGVIFGVLGNEVGTNNYYLDNLENAEDAKYENSYFPLSSSQMKQQSSYIGFDFDNVWAISPDKNNGYPYIQVAERGIPSATKQNKLVGSTVHFGDYDWLVLDVQGNKALLLTKEIIEYRPYHTELVDITWEKCTLREYLNGEFYHSFSTEDKNRIVESSVTNAANPEYGTDGGASTNDKIFLLSLDEAKYYFPNDAARIVRKNDGSDAFWWLRSPGLETILAATVLGSGKQDNTRSGTLGYAGSGVNYDNRGVRPALWLTLN